MFRVLLLSVLFFLVHHPVSAESWLQFRGPGGQGSSNATGLPVEWDGENNLDWKIGLPGYGASSPISLNGRLYLTCYSGYRAGKGSSDDMEDLRLHVVCLDQANGETIWDKKIKPRLPESERVRDHGYSAATPTTDGESLFVFFGKSGVFSFDLDGNEKWRTLVGDKTHGWGCGTSPVLFEDIVIVNASVESGKLFGLNKHTGEVMWEARGMKRSWNTPHLVKTESGQTEVVVSVAGSILGFDPQTGKQLWDCYGIQDYVCPSVISKDGVVYAIGGRSSRAIAVKAGGRGDVTDTHRLWEAKAGANVSSPVIHDGHLYWVSDRNRTAYCVRMEDGEIMYAKRFRGQPYASTIVADDKLYVVTRYSGTFVLAAQPDFEILSHNKLDDESTFNASPIVSDGQIFIRSDENLYCVGKK